MENTFPPRLDVGNRVWTTRGYHNHGPLDGPKNDIAPDMGGTITETKNPGYTVTGSMLHTVNWDNGQISKHYSDGLFCIGRFQSRNDFENAIDIMGPIDLTEGPMGGFRHVKIDLKYDGHAQQLQLYNGKLWIECLAQLAKRQSVAVNTIRLPGKPRKPRSPKSAT